MEEPGLKSQSGKVGVPASHCLPSWWALWRVQESPQEGKERGEGGSTGLMASVAGETHGTVAHPSSRWSTPRTVSQIRKGWNDEVPSQNWSLRPYPQTGGDSLGLWWGLLSHIHLCKTTEFCLLKKNPNLLKIKLYKINKLEVGGKGASLHKEFFTWK